MYSANNQNAEHIYLWGDYSLFLQVIKHRYALWIHLLGSLQKQNCLIVKEKYISKLF